MARRQQRGDKDAQTRALVFTYCIGRRASNTGRHARTDATHLGDLPRLVVAPQDGNAVLVPDFERHQQRCHLHLGCVEDDDDGCA